MSMSLGIGLGLTFGRGGVGNSIAFGDSIIFAGDSITANGFANTSVQSALVVRNFGAWALTLADQPFRLTANSNAGVGGDTSTQLLARYDADVVAHSPGVVTIHIGTNDLASIAAATTISNITSMLASNASMGAHTYLLKIMPRGSVGSPMNGTQLAAWETVNAWIATQASRTVTVVDTEPVIGAMDANHTVLAGMTDDNLHLSQLGAYTVGKLLATKFAVNASAGTILDIENNAAGNLASNGFFTGTGGTVANATGQVATSWIGQGSSAGGATVAYAKVARSDGYGEWQEMTVSGTYTGAGKVIRVNRAITVTGTLLAGDVVRCVCEVEVDAGLVAVLASRMFMDFGTDDLYSLKEYLTQLPTGEAWSGVLSTMPFTLSVSPTNLNVDIGMLLKTTGTTDAVAGTMRVGRFRVEKVV